MAISNLGNLRKDYTQYIKVRESLIHGRSEDREDDGFSKSGDHRINFRKELHCKDNQTIKLSLLSVFIPVSYYTIDKTNNKFTIQVKTNNVHRGLGDSADGQTIVTTAQAEGQKSPYPNFWPDKHAFKPENSNADANEFVVASGTGVPFFGVETSPKQDFDNKFRYPGQQDEIKGVEYTGDLANNSINHKFTETSVASGNGIFVPGNGIVDIEIPCGNYTAQELADAMTVATNRAFDYTFEEINKNKKLIAIIEDRYSCRLTANEVTDWARVIVKYNGGTSGTKPFGGEPSTWNDPTSNTNSDFPADFGVNFNTSGEVLAEYGNIPTGTNRGVNDVNDAYRYLVWANKSSTVVNQDKTFNRNLDYDNGIGHADIRRHSFKFVADLLPAPITTPTSTLAAYDTTNQPTFMQTLRINGIDYTGTRAKVNAAQSKLGQNPGFPRVSGITPKFRFFFDSTTGQINILRTDMGRLFDGGGFRILFGELGKQLGYNYLDEKTYAEDLDPHSIMFRHYLKSTSVANPINGKNVEHDNQGYVYESRLYNEKSKYLSGAVSCKESNYNAYDSEINNSAFNVTNSGLIDGEVFNDGNIRYYSQRIIAPRQANVGRDTLFFRTNYKGVGYDSQTQDHSDILAVVPVNVTEGDKLFYEPINLLRTDIGKSNRIDYLDIKITDSNHKPINFRGGEFEYCILAETFDIVTIPIHRDKSGEVNSRYSSQEAETFAQTQMTHTRPDLQSRGRDRQRTSYSRSGMAALGRTSDANMGAAAGGQAAGMSTTTGSQVGREGTYAS